MSKAILLMYMPTNCKECRLRFEDDYSDWCPCDIERKGTTDVFDYVKNLTKPDWCPLKQVPEKSLTGKSDYYQWGDWEDGYNTCIDEILEE